MDASLEGENFCPLLEGDPSWDRRQRHIANLETNHVIFSLGTLLPGHGFTEHHVQLFSACLEEAQDHSPAFLRHLACARGPHAPNLRYFHLGVFRSFS